MLLLLAVACGGPGDVVQEVEPQGWLAEVAHEPAAFASLLEQEGREGWVALHAHRYAEAWNALPNGATGRARAAWQLAVLHQDLSRLAGLVHDQLFQEWDQRTGLPKGSVAPVVAALAARCTGIGDPARWQTGAAPGAEVLAGAPDAWWTVDLPEGHPWSGRVAMHRAALDGDLAALTPDPVVIEPAEGFSRTFYDPCLHSTLAAAWTARLGDWRAAASELSGDPLGARLFSPWLDARDLADRSQVDRPGLVGLTSPTLSLPPLKAEDALQPARERVQALDDLLGAWQQALARQAPPDGQALLTELGLVHRFRQEHLVVLARAALLDDRPQQARVLLQLARDAASRQVGPRNGPQLFALLAEAELRTGRAREALDALQILAEAHPEVQGLREITGDLTVLRGLDRQGDSREE